MRKTAEDRWEMGCGKSTARKTAVAEPTVDQTRAKVKKAMTTAFAGELAVRKLATVGAPAPLLVSGA